MNDTDPRPMPTAVLAAYRDPLDLRALLASSVFTNIDRFDVRDKLLDRLIARYGNVEVESEEGSLMLPIRNRIDQLKKDPWAGIDLLLSIEEFGGKGAVHLEIAAVMQPYWVRWWESMNWKKYEEFHKHLNVSSIVLGQRHLVWLAAQYARSVVDMTRPSEQRICVDAIKAAEAWAIAPSEINRNIAKTASEAAYAVANAADYFNNAANAAIVSAAAAGDANATAAVTASDTIAVVDSAAEAAYVAARSADGSGTLNAAEAAYAAALKNLCALTKRLIAPTLITSASRGIR